jgi:7-carboxy-7-deazaguanine synthase
MHGLNPIRQPVLSDGQALAIQEIFPTLQGEGPYTGWPAVFVRLGGCNLACDFCDTEFESFEDWSVTDVVQRVLQFATPMGKRAADLVVITGGEPLRQNIAPLCEALIEDDFLVQIETNGTLFRSLPYGVDIVCSPKASNGRYHQLRADLLERVSALKFIISAGQSDYFDVPEVGQKDRQIPVYVQPMDEGDEAKNNANITRAIQLCSERGYRLSLQTHKILGLR